jgi:hypothetical protein
VSRVNVGAFLANETVFLVMGFHNSSRFFLSRKKSESEKCVFRLNSKPSCAAEKVKKTKK